MADELHRITSVRNPRIRALTELHRSRGRREAGRHLAEGPKVVTEALRAGLVVEVLGTSEALDAFEVAADVPVTIVSEHVLERLADARTPQGVVAVVRTPVSDLTTLEGPGLVVVLVALGDPGNVGTIVRTADAAGARAVVLTDGTADPFGPKVVRAAAGSTYHLPVVAGVSIDEVLATCRRGGRGVAALDGRAERSVFGLDGDEPLALLLGNEAHGLPDDVVDRADLTAAVPLRGGAESLNVAAAAAVAIYAAAYGLHPSS